MPYDSHPLGRPLLAIGFYNNGPHAKICLASIPSERNFDLLLHDDGSTDGTLDLLEASGYPVIRNPTNRGIGRSLKNIYLYAKDHGYKVLAVMAGNSKDDPTQAERLFAPIYQDGADYVQGSRRLPGGSSENLPFFRQVMVPAHAFAVSWLTGVPCTDALNGFRAYKTSLLFDDPRIHLWQEWLDQYELETYLHYKVLSLGYKAVEVPVSKSYSHFQPKAKYSHIRPLLDWWSIMRPLLYLKLRIRK